MNTPPDHDAEFESALRTRRRLVPRFDADDDAEPSPELDRIVIGRARDALRAPAIAASTVAPDVAPLRPAARERHYRGPRWAVPLALAATVMLSFVLVMQLDPARNSPLDDGRARSAVTAAQGAAEESAPLVAAPEENTAADAVPAKAPTAEPAIASTGAPAAAPPAALSAKQVPLPPDASPAPQLRSAPPAAPSAPRAPAAAPPPARALAPAAAPPPPPPPALATPAEAYARNSTAIADVTDRPAPAASSMAAESERANERASNSATLREPRAMARREAAPPTASERVTAKAAAADATAAADSVDAAAATTGPASAAGSARAAGAAATADAPQGYRSRAAWLADIERLRQRGELEAARKQLAEFRRRFPDEPLPAALEALLH